MNVPLEALQGMIQLAVADQQDYLQFGDTNSDYGDEWPEVARRRAQEWRMVAEWLSAIGGWSGLVDEMETVADCLGKSADEYHEATS